MWPAPLHSSSYLRVHVKRSPNLIGRHLSSPRCCRKRNFSANTEKPGQTSALVCTSLGLNITRRPTLKQRNVLFASLIASPLSVTGSLLYVITSLCRVSATLARYGALFFFSDFFLRPGLEKMNEISSVLMSEVTVCAREVQWLAHYRLMIERSLVQMPDWLVTIAFVSKPAIASLVSV